MMSMRYMVCAGALLAVFSIAPAFVHAEGGKVDKSSEVLVKVHDTNQKEIELGKIASQKAVASEVRKYSEMLIEHHTQADQKVTVLAKENNIVLGPVAGTPKEKKSQEAYDETRTKLENAKGKEFDRLYLQQMIADHRKGIQMLNRTKKDVGNANVKGFIDELLPTLRKHLSEAQNTLNAIQG